MKRLRRNRRHRHHHHHGVDWRLGNYPTETPNLPESSERSSELDSASSSTSRSSTSPSSAPELPGFYYDPEKNRYFRLLPGHNNCNPLTREMLEQKKRERQRTELLAADEQPRKKAPRRGLNSTLLLRRRSMGELQTSSYCSLVHEVRVSMMKRHKLEVQSADSSSPNTKNLRLMVADSACERVFMANDLSHGGCHHGIMNLAGCRNGSLSVTCSSVYYTNRKATSACWASVTHQDSHILLCMLKSPQNPGCVGLLPAALFANSSPNQARTRRHFNIATAWSCAWCLNPQADKTFSTGLSQSVILTDAVTGLQQTYSTESDVLAQTFALRAPVLFNGCRSGEIFSIDIRQRGWGRDHSWKSCHFRHDSAVTSVQLLQDENYLLAADMLGKIKMWDVRARRAVKQYDGHHNEYAHLPLHLCEQEGLLLAVGQDCYTRLWSLRYGHLLRTIPSPHPTGKDSIPSVVFSSQLGGRRGLPALLMAVCHDLYYYPYADYQSGTATESHG